MDEQSVDYIAQVHAAKKRKTIIGIVAAVLCLLLILFIFTDNSEKGVVLDEVTALNLAPALALTEEELALADTILDHDIFRNALSYDMVENSTVFSLEETEAVIGAVIPEGAAVDEIAVIGAVVVIDCRLAPYRCILEYVDADRSGQVDSIRKSIVPIIDGTSTGIYVLSHNFTTGKSVYTYTQY